MTQFIRSAVLHPATVTRLSMDEVAPVRPPRRRVAGRRGSTTTIVPDPKVWAVAVKLSGNRACLIEARSTTEVVVHNTPLWRQNRK